MLGIPKLTMQKQMIIGATILVFGLLSFYVYTTYAKPLLNKRVEANMEHNTRSGQARQSVEVMFFYADWCPHCKKAKSHWVNLKNSDVGNGKNVNGYTIHYTDVDCTDDKNSETQEKLNKFKVDGFPTIKMIKGTEVIEFDAKPELETLKGFIEATLNK